MPTLPQGPRDHKDAQMRKANISLIGFRATGKSTVGRILAEELACPFIDMDERLTLSFGREIRDWVRESGWESFRRAESDLLRTLALREGIVVATGGGIVLEKSNREILKEHFYNVWLTASPELLFRRLTADPRTLSDRPALTPLSLREEISHTLRERHAHYEETADLTVDTERSTAAGTCRRHQKGRRRTELLPPRLTAESRVHPSRSTDRLRFAKRPHNSPIHPALSCRRKFGIRARSHSRFRQKACGMTQRL